MKAYSVLSKITLLKKYSFKFLFVAFLGIHIPLIGLIVYLIFTDLSNVNPFHILFVVLGITLVATGITLIILNALLKPIVMTKDFLNDYINKNEIGELPRDYDDEVGVLMKDVDYSVNYLDELIKEKQDLIALMSHDLKNPLAAVMNYSEMIKGDEKYKAVAEKILSASETQKLIIDNVLEMLEQDNVIMSNEKYEKFKVEELFEGIIDRYSSKSKEKNIKVNTEYNDSEVFGNKNLISQVFDNIYGNSLKFTENGEINIKCQRENNQTKIIIEDDGIGFNQEVAEHLFDRFTKYKRKGTQNEATTGLGLYLCKKIITRHGGKISAESAGKDKGSKFIIHLN